MNEQLVGENREILRMVVFMNSYVRGLSGGDLRFIEVFKRDTNFRKVVVVAKKAKRILKERGIEANYVVTTKEEELKNLIVTYVKRILLGLFVIFREALWKADLVYATSDFLPDTLLCFLCALLGSARWIQVVHHVYPDWRARPGSKFGNFIAFYSQRLSFFLMKRQVDFIITVSPETKKNLVNLGFADSVIGINGNGINIDYFSNLSTEQAIASYEGAFLGRIHPSKGVFDLVTIWEKVCEELPDARLGIIGSGSDDVMGELKKKIEVAKLGNNVDVLGFLEDDVAFSTLKASRVFLFPSYEEGFGIAPLEAQACGLPVVAWDLPVFEEIFPQGMIKVSEGCVGEFADSVISLLENEGNLSLLSSKAQQNSQQYSWESVANREFELILELF